MDIIRVRGALDFLFGARTIPSKGEESELSQPDEP